MNSQALKFLRMQNQLPMDFTTSTMSRDVEDSAYDNDIEEEPLVLDLSCKRYSESSSDLGTSNNKMNPEDHRGGIKSPFEGRFYMVTPPSETDSPRKTKYEPIYGHINSTTSDLALPHYSTVKEVPTGRLFSANPASRSLPGLVTSPGHQFTQNRLTSMFQIESSDYHKVGLVSIPSQSPEIPKKIPRPFKAYPKDPLALTMRTTEFICDQNSNEAYSEFRKRMLESVKKTNEGTNIKMRRTIKSPGLPTSTMDDKDAAYWERRRKNNEAAKRSRDARRAKEDEIAIRAAFLEQENGDLKKEVKMLRSEAAKLRCLVYSR